MLSILLAAALVYLAFGTDVIPPALSVIAAAAAAGFLFWHIRHEWKPRYTVAQIVDRRLRLYDALSTAWFVLEQGKPRTPLAEYQIRQANELASQVDPRGAFPLRFGRDWAVPGALALAAIALSVARYSETGKLNLESSVVPPHAVSWLSAQAEAWEKKFSPDRNRANGGSARRNGRRSGGRELGERDPSGRDVNSDQTASSKTAGDPAASVDASARNSLQQLEKQFSPDRTNDDSRSLLSKMQDALGGMLAKAQQKLAPKSQNSDGSGSQQQQQQANKGQAGPSSKANRDGSRENAQDSQARAASSAIPQAIEKSSNAMLGNDSQRAMDSGNNSQSGAGRNDGRKEVQSAEELKAIGKLQELIGKRSAAITGDMRITKPSHNPQLATPYSDTVGEHTDRGEEIDTDEIPPEYRDFVKAYMEAVHQHAPPAPANPPKN